jgi:hypothetical protein
MVPPIPLPRKDLTMKRNKWKSDRLQGGLELQAKSTDISERLVPGIRWRYIANYQQKLDSPKSNIIELEIVSIEKNSIVFKHWNKTRGSTSIFRVDSETGVVAGHKYHYRWWIPVPASAPKIPIGLRYGGLDSDEPNDFDFDVFNGSIALRGASVPAIRLEGRWTEYPTKDFETLVVATNWYSAELGILLISQIENINRPIGEALQIALDSEKLGLGPVEELHGRTRHNFELDRQSFSELFPGLTEYEHDDGLVKGVVKEKETIIKEVVKVRCRFCKKLYDESADSCPYCGGAR